jgi:hypothetical protein
VDEKGMIFMDILININEENEVLISWNKSKKSDFVKTAAEKLYIW